MTDTVKLKDKILEVGVSVSSIATRMGMTREGLYNKLNGRTEFKGSEIARISKILGLSVKERDDIFFAK